MGFRRLFAGLLVAGLLSGSQLLWSQAGREKVLEGNRNYSEGDYDKALELYREALAESPDSPVIRFNLGDAHFKKEDLEDASDSFSQALQSEDPEIKSRAQYNLGNSLYRQGKLQESLSAYREALKVAPGDRDAKHNLEFVLKQLQEQQQQQQQQKDQNQQGEGEQEEDQDKDKDESRSGGEDQSQQGQEDQPEDQEGQDQQDEEQQSQAQNDREDSGDPEQRPGDRQENGDEESRASGGQQEETPEEDQAQARPEGVQPMSREEAERLLEALAQAQAGVKKKLELRPGNVRVEKDW